MAVCVFKDSRCAHASPDSAPPAAILHCADSPASAAAQFDLARLFASCMPSNSASLQWTMTALEWPGCCLPSTSASQEQPRPSPPMAVRWPHSAASMHAWLGTGCAAPQSCPAPPIEANRRRVAALVQCMRTCASLRGWSTSLLQRSPSPGPAAALLPRGCCTVATRHTALTMSTTDKRHQRSYGSSIMNRARFVPKYTTTEPAACHAGARCSVACVSQASVQVADMALSTISALASRSCDSLRQHTMETGTADCMPVADGTVSWAVAHASSGPTALFLLSLARQKRLDSLSPQPMCAQPQWLLTLPRILAVQTGLQALAHAVAEAQVGVDEGVIWPLLDLLDRTLQCSGVATTPTLTVRWHPH